MGRDLHYRPGSWYMVDDRTGFAQRSERMKREWDNLMVDRARWEIRQPQDYVRGVRDDQTVPVARPHSKPKFSGPTFYELAADSPGGSELLSLVEADGIVQGDELWVILDTGAVFITFASALNGDLIGIQPGLPSLASAGNIVVDTHLNGGGPFENFLVTEGGVPLTTDGGVKITVDVETGHFVFGNSPFGTGEF